MLRILYVIVIAILALAISCKSIKVKKNNPMIVSGSVKTIHSEVLSQDREIWIFSPESEMTSDTTSYPVIYLLDPDEHFNNVVSIIKLFGGGEGKGLFPKMIVVGVVTPDRVHDLTPSFDPSPSESSSVPLKSSDYRTAGGAEAFTQFISNEVIPYIDSTFNVSDVRILVGHSFGGLMTVNTLLNNTDIFSGYIAVDPSNWWNHQETYKRASQIVGTKDFGNHAFFYANSNSAREFAGKMTDTISRNPYKSQLQFGSLFAEHKENIPKFEWIHYDHETHGTIPFIAIFDGLKVMSDILCSPGGDTPFNGEQKGWAYGNYSDYSRDVNEVIGKVGILFPGYDKYSSDNDCLKLFDDTIHTSKNLFRVVGDLLSERGDTTGALECFKSSLRLYPGDAYTESRIKEIENKFLEK